MLHSNGQYRCLVHFRRPLLQPHCDLNLLNHRPNLSSVLVAVCGLIPHHCWRRQNVKFRYQSLYSLYRDLASAHLVDLRHRRSNLSQILSNLVCYPPNPNVALRFQILIHDLTPSLGRDRYVDFLPEMPIADSIESLLHSPMLPMPSQLLEVMARSPCELLHHSPMVPTQSRKSIPNLRADHVTRRREPKLRCVRCFPSPTCATPYTKEYVRKTLHHPLTAATGNSICCPILTNHLAYPT